MTESIIDEISEDKSGNVILLLRQPRRWDNCKALPELQQRLNGYIDVLKRELLYQTYPRLRGKPVRIRLLCYHFPTEETKTKLDRANQTLHDLGIGFEIVHIEVQKSENSRRPMKEIIRSIFRRKQS